MINMILAFHIIAQEIKRPKFCQWFQMNSWVTSYFTVLAGADIEALSILQSNIAGSQSFQAPFSESAKSKIFWGAFLSIFIEDIPRVAIQVRI